MKFGLLLMAMENITEFPLINSSRNLKVFTSYWSMSPHDQTGIKLSDEKICALIKDAGYKIINPNHHKLNAKLGLYCTALSA